MQLDNRDLQQIRGKGIPEEVIDRQIGNFIHGFPWAGLVRPATIGDGIFAFGEEEIARYEDFFNSHMESQRPVKFVPASGAASRMFKKLFEFNDGNADDGSVKDLLDRIGETAFYGDLDRLLQKKHGKGIAGLTEEKQYKSIIGAILSDEGLNYANLPKGLLLFHSYPDGSRTAAEEHLVEAASYARDSAGIARIHFTISPEHRTKFAELFDRVRIKYEERFGITFEISFSEQKPSTDTIAVDEQNRPIRNPDGSLLFRPGGHGALIRNLNDIDADIIFIKNIDNIVPDRLKGETILYKKVLGGYLLRMKQIIHGFLDKASRGAVSDADTGEIIGFMREKLFLALPEGFEGSGKQKQLEILVSMLDRPMRVCGMVKNEGEPGGGPFWITSGEGSASLQIIESSQVNVKDPAQKAVMDRATHFNPVDLVCCTKDYKGNTIDLGKFVDPSTGFIAVKSSGGKVLKAQELPGLWNGAMAKWITVFVEVPVITFNPVKTVNDLLREEHL